MGKDGSGRRSAWDLFAERQVHMRTGEESRYVVLSRPLQIGVAAGFFAIVALLAIASYAAIARHVALVAQQGMLAEERAAAEDLAERLAGELASLRQQREAAEREIERLTTALDQAQAERMEALAASREAGAKAAELEAILAATSQPEAPAAGASRPAPGSAEREALRAEITGLRAELERVNRETLALRRTAGEARQALRDLQGGAGPQAPQVLPDPRGLPALTAMPAGEIRRLQEDLADAQATVATLGADLEALKGAGTGADRTADAAAELALLEEQLGSAHRRAEQLGSLAAAQPEEVDALPGAAADSPAGTPADPAPRPSPRAPR